MDSESLRKALEEARWYFDNGWPDHAEMLFNQIIGSTPDAAAALHALGALRIRAGRRAQGIELLRRAAAISPNDAELHNSLGVALGEDGRLDEAVAHFQQAVRIKPDYAGAYANLGLAMTKQDKLDESVGHFKQALTLECTHQNAQNNLGFALGELGRAVESETAFRRALELAPDFYLTHTNLVFFVNFWPGQDARSICEELARWNRQHTQPLAKFIGPHSNDRSPGRRLRVGYVSPCFWDHCQAFFLMPLLSAHDRSQVEVVCYSDAGKRDAVTDRLRGHADLWREVRGLTDEQLCSLVREDRIDILVDLNMHMAQSRLQAFARKPAPVQVCWLAYPGTTGLPAIDYRLTDPHLDPPGLNDRFYSEQSIRLRDSFWCYDPLTVEPSVSPLPALTNGLVTFGCLNTFRKVNDDVLELWARAMGRVGRSRLVLLAPQGNCRQHVLDVFKAKGVSPDRVLFQDRQSRLGYLESYKQIDIGLDTFPYNGHTTSLDSFWMGVPVITIVGSTVVGRAGLSQLMNLGLPELIAHTPEEFVKIAAQLASDLPHLSELRAGLRDRMQRSPLMDAPRFARSMEAAYRDMWHRWCSK